MDKNIFSVKLSLIGIRFTFFVMFSIHSTEWKKEKEKYNWNIFFFFYGTVIESQVVKLTSFIQLFFINNWLVGIARRAGDRTRCLERQRDTQKISHIFFSLD